MKRNLFFSKIVSGIILTMFLTIITHTKGHAQFQVQGGSTYATLEQAVVAVPNDGTIHVTRNMPVNEVHLLTGASQSIQAAN